MSKCRNCGRHGLFLMVNIHTGLCSDCQKKLSEAKPPETVDIPKPAERSLEIPTVYIGNGMKYRITQHFDDVELMRPDALPDFSKIALLDKVSFCVDGESVCAKNYSQILGFVADVNLVSEIRKSLNEKRPIFSKILGYDDETGEIHVVIAFCKIENYDYSDYVMEKDESLENEVVEYF